MIQLSSKFDLTSYTYSHVARVNGIINSTDNYAIISNLQDLHENIIVKILQEIKDYRLFVTSGYRSQELNKFIKGAKNSQHTKGQAVDLILVDEDMKQHNRTLFDICKNLEFDQLIREKVRNSEPAWIHISFVKENNRRQILTL